MSAEAVLTNVVTYLLGATTRSTFLNHVTTTAMFLLSPAELQPSLSLRKWNPYRTHLFAWGTLYDSLRPVPSHFKYKLPRQNLDTSFLDPNNLLFIVSLCSVISISLFRNSRAHGSFAAISNFKFHRTFLLNIGAFQRIEGRPSPPSLTLACKNAMGVSFGKLS